MADEDSEMSEGARVLGVLYREFMRLGGFRQPCVDEMRERAVRQTLVPQPTICPHGRSLLLCDICYFGKENGWGK